MLCKTMNVFIQRIDTTFDTEELIKCKNIHMTGASTNPKKVKEAINEMQVAKDIQYATSHINI